MNLYRRISELYEAVLPLKTAVDLWNLTGLESDLPSDGVVKTAVEGFEALNITPLRIFEEIQEIKAGEASPLFGEAGLSVAWGNVTEKPTTFEPAAHTHPAQVVAWTDVTEKPAEFVPRFAGIRYLGNGAVSRVISFTPGFRATAVILESSGGGVFMQTPAFLSRVDLSVSGQITVPQTLNYGGYYYDVIVL